MRLLRRVLKGTLVVVAVFVVWSLFRAGTPATAFRREIVVNVPPEVAWEHFNRPKEWASWLGPSGAPSDVGPSDVVGPETTATFAGSVTFRMQEFEPPEHWMWSAEMGWLNLDYDHVFEPIDDNGTRIVFHQTVTGFGNDLVAMLIGLTTALGGHQAALQALADEMNRLPGASR